MVLSAPKFFGKLVLGMLYYSPTPLLPPPAHGGSLVKLGDGGRYGQPIPQIINTEVLHEQ